MSCRIATFAYKPSINSKIKKKNIYCRSKLAIKNIWENPKYIMVHTKKEEKVRPECSIWIFHVLNSMFPDLLATQIVEI